MDETRIKQQIAEFVDEDEERADLYLAYMAGVNVGMEAEQSERARDMTAEEFTEWLQAMFEARVESEL